MEAPEVSTGQAEAVESQTDQDQSDGVYVPDDDLEVAEVEQETDEQPTPSESSDEPGPAPEPKPEAKEEPKDDEINSQLQSLKQQINDLNRALHHERQKAKERDKAKESDEPVLTDAQIKELIRTHGDDPDTLLQINRYIAEQAAKKASKESVDAQQLAQMKAKVDAHVSTAYPELYQEGSQARGYVEKIKGSLNLSSHPFGDYLAASAWVADNIEVIKKQEYERGKEEGLKGKVNETRKQNIKTSAPIPPKPASKKVSVKIPDEVREVADRLEMTPDQMKIYAKLRGKSNSMMEA